MNWVRLAIVILSPAVSKNELTWSSNDVYEEAWVATENVRLATLLLNTLLAVNSL